MPHRFRSRLVSTVAAAAGILGGIAGAGKAYAVEVSNLSGFEELFGRYAPGGDCKRQPQILVDLSGMTFEVPGATIKVTDAEYAASYGPSDYQGIAKWFFPFRITDGYPILMTFNANERKGVLLIEPQDEGYQGGPALSARNKALVGGSPYTRCK